MEKPIKPLEPDVFNKKKYPRLQITEESPKNYLGQKIPGPNDDFIRDYRKYQEDREKYEQDIELYWQIKFIEDIKRSTLKLCLKKYQIIKR